MSVRAVEWALWDAPDVPTQCFGVLVGLAWRADDNGRSSFPSEANLAACARKSARQVRRDLVELKALGLIRDGDPRAAVGVRSGYRPHVYDLAVERVRESGRPRPVSPDEGGHGRPVSDDQGGRTRPVSDVQGGHPRPVSRVDTHVQGDRTPTSTERSLKARTTGHLGRAGGVSRTRTRVRASAGRADSECQSTMDSPHVADSVDPASVVDDPAEEGERKRKPKSAGSTQKANSNGCRLPDNFAVTPEMVSWARENTPDVNGRLETESFIDYWRGAPGAKGRKRDWPATWRNWMRKAQQNAEDRNARRSRASPPGLSQTDATVARLLNGQPLGYHHPVQAHIPLPGTES